MDSAAPGDAHQNMRDVIRTWLASWDFVDDPFGSWEAGREPWLERYFVRRPFYEQLLESPNSALIFAPRGGGKTAMRIMIASECRPAVPTSKVLAVPFTDFSPFVEALTSPTRLSLADYLPHLLSSALPPLIMAACDIPLLGGRFLEGHLAELRYWVEQYAPHYLSPEYLPTFLRKISPPALEEHLAVWIEALQQDNIAESRLDAPARVKGFIVLWRKMVEVQPTAPLLPSTSPSHIMAAFLDFVRRFLTLGRGRCQNVFFLVDGIDEYDITQDDPNAAATVLRPLLGNLRFLELPGLAVKFFLPLEQQASLEKVARTDRLETYVLTWDKGSHPDDEFQGLRTMLRQRIRAFNTANIRSLAEMCVPALRPWIEDAMLEAAAGSPRNLLRLGHQIFVEHCRDIPAPESEIQRQDWERALHWFHTRLSPTLSKVEHTTSSVRQHHAEGDDLLLRVDLETRKVYRGSRAIEDELSDLEFQLLAYLYRHKGKICSREELCEAVYGVGTIVSPEMLNSLVYRLRQKIELPGKSEHFIRTVRGRGYRLENAL